MNEKVNGAAHAAPNARVGEHDIEDLTQARLSIELQEELLSTQTECTLVFRGPDGAPSGSVLSFVYHDGSLWFASVRGRVQVESIEVDPQVSVVISNAGTALPGRRMLSLRGTATITSDPTAMEPVLKMLAARLAPGEEDAFLGLLRSPGRRVIEVRPSRVVASHNSGRMAGNGRGGGAG